MTNLVVFLNLDVFACRFIGILFHFGFNFGAHLLLSSSANDHNMAVHKCLGLRMISKITKMNSLRFASQHLWTLESSPAFHWGTSGGNSFFSSRSFWGAEQKTSWWLGRQSRTEPRLRHPIPIRRCPKWNSTMTMTDLRYPSRCYFWLGIKHTCAHI